MQSSHFSRFIFLILIVSIFLNVSVLKSNASLNRNTDNPTFNVSQSTTRILISSPIYNNDSRLFMTVDAGILPNNSNPYIKYSLLNADTQKEVFSSTYVFHEIIEYTPANDSQIGPDSSSIKKITNIGNPGTLGPNMQIRGYNPITNTNNTFQDQVMHSFVLSTNNDIFSLTLNVPEGTVYPNGIEVDVPGIFFTINLQNYPYQSNTNNISLDVHILSSYSDTIDPIGSNSLYLYRNYNATVSSTFYLQNAFFSNLQDQPLSLDIRDLSSYFNFLSPNRNNVSLNGYIGQINANPNIPDQYLTGSSGTNGKAGILDFTVNANAFNLQVTGNQLALATISLAGFAGIIALVYYFIRKYLVIILGVIVAIGVSIYLPTRKVTAIQALHHEKRREIMDALYIVGGKGMLMKELKELIQLPQTTLLWHLDILQEFEFITRVKIHKQIIIISNDFLEDFDPRLKELELSFVSDQGEKFRKFISSKDLQEPFTILEIVKETNWHEKTVKRHLKKLMNLGIISPVQNSNKFVVAPEFHAHFSKIDS